MGWVKNMMIEQQERGYGSSDKMVCHNCVGDLYLKEYIEEYGQEGICDYCGSDDVSICLEDLMEPIMNGIKQEYEDANNCMGWNGREGGFIGADTYDSYDLIHEEIAYELQFGADDLYDDVANLINDSITWCQRDPYGNLPYDEDYYTWERYVNALKKHGDKVAFEKESDSSYTSPDQILERISEGIIQLELIDTIPIGSNFWRARAHKERDVVDSAATLGSPKEELAGCNRMTKRGESAFYGAFDKDTALKEIANQKRPMKTVGRFSNIKPITVINFSKLNTKPIPSLFDVENSDLRMLMIFLKRFNSEISQPVVNKDEQEYIPTQNVMHYLRKELRTKDDLKIEGVIYNSSQYAGGICCVLFIDWQQCSDERDKVLWLDPTSLVRM